MLGLEQEVPAELTPDQTDAWKRGWLAGYERAASVWQNQDSLFKFEWVFNNCKIVYWPEIGDGALPYTIEHDLRAGKDMRVLLESYIRKRKS